MKEGWKKFTVEPGALVSRPSVAAAFRPLTDHVDQLPHYRAVILLNPCPVVLAVGARGGPFKRVLAAVGL